jgi:VanZ family protein
MSEPRPHFRVLPFVLATGVAAALILAAPFIGEIRRAILTRFPGQFVHIISAVVVLAVATAVLIALARIREQRGWRYGAIALSLVVGMAYALAFRSGDPQVDAVERFHFVEYGLVTLLFYRAWRPAGDLSVIVLPVLAGLLVGTFEEWFQWFIPARVGDVWDIFLNGVAIACGLIFSVALDPPVGFTPTLTRAGLRRVGAFGALLLVVFAAFFQSVHLGSLIAGDRWRFRSCSTAAELDQASADRTTQWRNVVIERPKRLSAEDQYATEGLWHVQKRNLAWQANDVTAAWYENLILERYFAPVLDTPSYVSRTGHRWAREHRAEAERRFAAAPAAAEYESQAQPATIHVWPKRWYWMVVAALALLLTSPWLLHRAART